MQNFAVKTADMGYNVLYISLEMSVKKCLKRTGAMRLRIPINEYDEMSRNPEFIKSKIDELHRYKTGDMFESKIGKLLTKFYAAGTATVSDFDRLVNSIQQKRGIKIHMIVVDYITLIAAAKGVASENLYQKGKHLAEALRAMGAKYNIPIITGIQVAKDAWNASDITLESIPESKAIAETADSFFAIIRTEEMKRLNKYRLKLLKQRDGDLSRTQMMFDLNPTYLTIENDNFIENT
jgi:replicative DNA helicase